MGIIIDNRVTRLVLTDRENHQYAEDKHITKLICDDNRSLIDLICHLVFKDKDLTAKEYNFIIELYTICIINKSNSLNKIAILNFIADRNNISYRTLDRYVKKLIGFGILSQIDNTISFTKYYNPINIKFPITDFIVIEVNPDKTSNNIIL